MDDQGEIPRRNLSGILGGLDTLPTYLLCYCSLPRPRLLYSISEGYSRKETPNKLDSARGYSSSSTLVNRIVDYWLSL